MTIDQAIGRLFANTENVTIWNAWGYSKQRIWSGIAYNIPHQYRMMAIDRFIGQGDPGNINILMSGSMLSIPGFTIGGGR